MTWQARIFTMTVLEMLRLFLTKKRSMNPPLRETEVSFRLNYQNDHSFKFCGLHSRNSYNTVFIGRQYLQCGRIIRNYSWADKWNVIKSDLNTHRLYIINTVACVHDITNRCPISHGCGSRSIGYDEKSNHQNQ